MLVRINVEILTCGSAYSAERGSASLGAPIGQHLSD
jgi:hypothetical protein